MKDKALIAKEEKTPSSKKAYVRPTLKELGLVGEQTRASFGFTTDGLANSF